MTKVLVIGPSGAGKSTIARRLGAALGVAVVHMDQLYWRPGWKEAPREEFRAAVLEALEQPAWVIDGNYMSDGAGAERLAACDTIVALDFPRRVCFWRVMRRIAGSYGRVRPDLAEGCPEQIDLAFLRWVWDSPKRRPALLSLIERHRESKRVVVLRNRGDVARFVRSVQSTTRADGPASL